MNNINYSDSQSPNNNASIGTEYSNTSDNFNSLIQQVTKDNQIFENYDNLALDAANDNEFSVLSYLIKKNKIKNFGLQNKKNGFTILHYLIYNYSKIKDSDKLIDIILNNTNVKKFINIQDFINKDTPIHIATAFGHDNLVEKMIQKGADKTLRNANNEYVCTDNDQSAQNLNTDEQKGTNKVQNKNSNSNSNSDQDSVFISKNTLDDTIKNIANWFFKGSDNNQTSEASLRMTEALNGYDVNNTKNNESQNLSSTSAIASNTDQYINQLIGQQSDSLTPNVNNNNTTEQIINEIIQKQNATNIVNQSDENETNVDSSDVIRRIIDKQKKINNNSTANLPSNMQKGGKLISGRRTMKTVSDEMSGGQSEATTSIDPINDRDNQFKRNVGAFSTVTDWKNTGRDDTATSEDGEYQLLPHNSTKTNINDTYRTQNRSTNNDLSRTNDLSRMIQNQASVIHTRTIEKIKDLLGVDEEKAKIYKAALYNKVKNDHPELNGYDRAVEMEKIATTENLKEINLKQWGEKIKKDKENTSQQTEEKPKSQQKKTKKTEPISETSIFSLKSDSSISSLSSNDF